MKINSLICSKNGSKYHSTMDKLCGSLIALFFSIALMGASSFLNEGSASVVDTSLESSQTCSPFEYELGDYYSVGRDFKAQLEFTEIPFSLDNVTVLIEWRITTKLGSQVTGWDDTQFVLQPGQLTPFFDIWDGYTYTGPAANGDYVVDMQATIIDSSPYEPGCFGTQYEEGFVIGLAV